MTDQNLQSFLAFLAKDSSLQEKIKSTKEIEAISQLVSDLGFNLSVTELNTFLHGSAEVLDDSILESLSGGTGNTESTFCKPQWCDTSERGCDWSPGQYSTNKSTYDCSGN